MESFGEFFFLLIKQFAGGPGPIENNLMRFGLAAIFWLGLLIIAWVRQQNQNLPREKLLIWGFGFALARELIMFGLTARKITGFLDSGGEDIYFHPLEHGLEMAAVIVVAGAFLRYALDDERLSRRYLQAGLLITGFIMLVSFITWPKFANANPDVNFKETWESWVFHILSTFLIAVAIFILARKRDWLRTVVSLALGFLFFSELLLLVSYATGYTLCPISNALHILAIPIFGFVYLKEMSIEKKKTEEKLNNYRDHLEDLVSQRTAMLVAQNAIADSLSQSLDLETILSMALEKVLPVLSMESGLIFLLDQEQKDLSLEAYRGKLPQNDLALCLTEGCPYQDIAKEATESKEVVIQNLTTETQDEHTHIKKENTQVLISAPLISKNHIVGALALGSKKAAPLDQKSLELLVAVCNQIGMAVENAYLYRKAEIWAEDLSTLHQASVNLRATLDPEQINKEIVIQSAKLTGCKLAYVVSWEKQGKTLEIISGTGLKPETKAILEKDSVVYKLLDELFTTKKSIVINDVAQDARVPETWRSALDIHSLLCTPVRDINEQVEFLFIMDQRKSKSWQPKDVELVESFVSRAAVALENANLHRQLEWAAALEERQRIAANIHDGVAQIINLVGLKVDQTTELFPSQEKGEILEALGDIRQTVDRASIEVRKSITSLQSTPQPRKSLQEILTFLVEKRSVEDTLTFDITFSFPEPLFLHPDHVAQITPIIQEAISNARKHSNATQIQVNGQQLGNQVSITIKDDGKGFDIDDTISRDESHFGLRIMRARAARFDGKLQIISKPDHGTIVTLSWILNYESDRTKRD